MRTITIIKLPEGVHLPSQDDPWLIQSIAEAIFVCELMNIGPEVSDTQMFYNSCNLTVPAVYVEIVAEMPQARYDAIRQSKAPIDLLEFYMQTIDSAPPKIVGVEQRGSAQWMRIELMENIS